MGYPGQEQRAVHAAGDDHRILYVRPEIGIVRGAVPESVAPRYREVESRTWPGWFPLTVVVYEPL
jgi:hypothetical protein